MINVDEIKKDFPILSRKVGDYSLVYLDNAATSQKPVQVVEAISDYYLNHNANVHRGIHMLSEEATDMYEYSRTTVAQFINANKDSEVVFTSGTTEGLNLVAYGWGMLNVFEDDVILISGIEHHSNLVPWQQVAKAAKAKLEVIPFDITGTLLLEDIKNFLDLYENKVKAIVISHASNVLGTITPIKDIKKLVSNYNTKVIVDGAQAIPHMPVNVQNLGCDFYAFSGHKMLGPTGIGVLWGKQQLLEDMSPIKFGGGMIHEVAFTNSTWAKVPEKFEGGTPNIAGAVGLSAAIKYLNSVGIDNIREHEVLLTKYALEKLQGIEGLEILGPTDALKRTGLVAFTLKGIHAHDVAAVLNEQGVAVRSGHHCTMPLHTTLQIVASTRASYYLYNDKGDIDKLVSGILKAKEVLG
ncbi:MAG: cysteine desulfurase [Patescibacteria group bacterium]